MSLVKRRLYFSDRAAALAARVAHGGRFEELPEQDLRRRKDDVRYFVEFYVYDAPMPSKGVSG